MNVMKIANEPKLLCFCLAKVNEPQSGDVLYCYHVKTPGATLNILYCVACKRLSAPAEENR